MTIFLIVTAACVGAVWAMCQSPLARIIGCALDQFATSSRDLN